MWTPFGISTAHAQDAAAGGTAGIVMQLLPLVLIGWWRDGDPRMAWGQALGVAALWFVGAGGAAVLLRRYVEVPGAARARAFSTAARP